MQLDTVIFDMDGLLIDSEPLWTEAANEVFLQYQVQLTPQQHAITTGLRTNEYVEWWFAHFNIPASLIPEASKAMLQCVTEKILYKGKPMAGIEHIFNYFISRRFKIGLASSSDMQLINVVVDKLGIRKHLNAINSASELPFGKPHPQVYLNCAAEMQSHPGSCICFEDSFNGMIAAKAARMKCVVVPAHEESKQPRFSAADLKISSLQNFNDLLLFAL